MPNVILIEPPPLPSRACGKRWEDKSYRARPASSAVNLSIILTSTSYWSTAHHEASYTVPSLVDWVSSWRQGSDTNLAMKYPLPGYLLAALVACRVIQNLA